MQQMQWHLYETLPWDVKCNFQMATFYGYGDNMNSKNGKSAHIVYENIKSRSTCRAFLDKPVAKDVILKILDGANLAPCPHNTQPWEFIVTTGPELEKFRSMVREWLKSPRKKRSGDAASADDEAAREFLKFWPKYILKRGHAFEHWLQEQLVEKDIQLKNVYSSTYYCFHAPVVIFVVVDAVKRNRWGLMLHHAASAAIQNILLIAHSLGYGAVWDSDCTLSGDKLNECIGLPDGKEVVAGIGLGFPDTDNILNLPRPPKEDVGGKIYWRGFL
ncbi:nitroreductase family protein [Desulfocicer niacini]